MNHLFWANRFNSAHWRNQFKYIESRGLSQTFNDASSSILHSKLCNRLYWQICHLHDGAYFGEMALLLDESHRMTNTVALEISEICRLDKRHFLLCVDPESLPYKRLLEQALFRQKYLEQLRILHRTRLRSHTSLAKRTSRVSTTRTDVLNDMASSDGMRRTYSNPHLRRWG